MAHFCFICKRRAGGSKPEFPCFYCARAVADAIVLRPPAWVAERWHVTGEFVEARTLALERQPTPSDVEEYARVGAGLAVGYLGLGMQGAALATAALALSLGALGEEAPPWNATHVVFSAEMLSDAGRSLLAEEFGWTSSLPD